MDYDTLIQRITRRLEDDDRVRAAWLSGSRARGSADAYIDVDVWLVTAASDRDAFIADWPQLADSITPTVLNQQVGDLPVFHAVTSQWLRFDIAVATPADVPHRTRATLSVLFDKDGLDAQLRVAGKPLDPDPARVEKLISEFFRVLGLLPVVLGRSEFVLAASGAGMLRHMLIQLMLEDVAVADRGGALSLSPLLPPERMRVLAELPAPQADRASAVAAHLACAQAFLPLARELAARTGLAWPAELEAACAAHLQRELGLTLPGPRE